MERINGFREREGRRLSDARHEITSRIHQAIGADSNTHPNVVAKIGSLWLHQLELRPDIDGALATTEAGRKAGTIANPGAYLVRCIQNACRQHGVPWPGRQMRKQA